MLPRYIQNWIIAGEGLQLDFKHSIADSNKIAKSLVSFANSLGGTLLVGVNDKGRVVGVDENEETYMLEIAAKKYCKPSVPIRFAKHKTSDGKIIVECTIDEGSHKPYKCRDIEGKWKVFYRELDECKLASVVRYTLMTLANSDKNRTVYTEDDKKVIGLLQSHQDGLTKNLINRQLDFNHHMTVGILARLMYLNVIVEITSFDKTLYVLS